MLRATSNTGSH